MLGDVSEQLLVAIGEAHRATASPRRRQGWPDWRIRCAGAGIVHHLQSLGSAGFHPPRTPVQDSGDPRFVHSGRPQDGLVAARRCARVGARARGLPSQPFRRQDRTEMTRIIGSHASRPACGSASLDEGCEVPLTSAAPTRWRRLRVYEASTGDSATLRLGEWVSLLRCPAIPSHPWPVAMCVGASANCAAAALDRLMSARA